MPWGKPHSTFLQTLKISEVPFGDLKWCQLSHCQVNVTITHWSSGITNKQPGTVKVNGYRRNSTKFFWSTRWSQASSQVLLCVCNNITIWWGEFLTLVHTHTHQTPILFQLKGLLLYTDPLQHKLVDQYHVTTAMMSIWMGDKLKIEHTTCFSSLETNSSWPIVDTVSLLNSFSDLYNIK